MERTSAINIKSAKEQTNFAEVLFVFIALFFSSMVGAKIFGVSLNKAALLPLELFLFYKVVSSNKVIEIKSSTKFLLLFYVLQILNSTVALIFNSGYNIKYDNYSSTLMNNVIQNIFIYIPIVILLSNYPDKERIFKTALKCLVAVCRIHAFWALAQFILWQVEFDLNGFVFTDILNGALGENYQSNLANIGGSIVLRVTGLNFDPAYLSTLMIMGSCFDRRKLFNLLYLLCCTLAMSRVGMVVLVLLLVVRYAMAKKEHGFDMSTDNILKTLSVAVLIVMAFLIMYFSLDAFKVQVDKAIQRFAGVFSPSESKDGTSRHVLYPIYAIYCWIFDLNFLQKLIGVGARISGVVFTNSDFVKDNMTFNSTMLNSAWEIECDYAELLLGDGLIGIVLFLLILLALFRSKDKRFKLFGIVLFFYCVMYDTFAVTVLQVCLIFYFSCYNKYAYKKKSGQGVADVDKTKKDNTVPV